MEPDFETVTWELSDFDTGLAIGGATLPAGPHRQEKDHHRQTKITVRPYETSRLAAYRPDTRVVWAVMRASEPFSLSHESLTSYIDRCKQYIVLQKWRARDVYGGDHECSRY